MSTPILVNSLSQNLFVMSKSRLSLRAFLPQKNKPQISVRYIDSNRPRCVRFRPHAERRCFHLPISSPERNVRPDTQLEKDILRFCIPISDVWLKSQTLRGFTSVELILINDKRIKIRGLTLGHHFRHEIKLSLNCYQLGPPLVIKRSLHHTF